MTRQAKPAGTNRRHRGGPARRGDVPWPELGCGTAYVLDGETDWTVAHMEDESLVGKLQWIEWRHAESGEAMTLTERTGGKSKPKPGAWFATVSWRDEEMYRRAGQLSIAGRYPLLKLTHRPGL